MTTNVTRKLEVKRLEKKEKGGEKMFVRNSVLFRGLNKTVVPIMTALLFNAIYLSLTLLLFQPSIFMVVLNSHGLLTSAGH